MNLHSLVRLSFTQYHKVISYHWQWQLSNVWDLTYELWVERDVYSAHVIQIQVWSDISRECILSDNNQ